MGAADLGRLVEEVFIKDELRPTLHILGDHPHMLTRPRDPSSTTYHMADWPIPLISRRKPLTGSVISRHGHMAGFPVPLIDNRKPYTGSIFPRHARMADFLLPLVIKHAGTASQDGGNGFSFSKLLGLRTVSRR